MLEEITRSLHSTHLTTMKRKLNEEDVPAAVEPGDTLTNSSTFNTFGLDSRLLQAVAKENFLHPTNVQAKAIPLALEGKDILGMESSKQCSNLKAHFSSSLEDRFWQDCSIRPPHSPFYTSYKDRQ